MISNFLAVCHIITTFIISSGSTRRTLTEIHHQIKIGCRVGIIVGGDVTDNLLEECQRCGVEVYRVNALRKHIDIGADFRAVWEIFQILKREGFDLVHTHLAKAGIVGRVAARLARVPIIIHSVHGPSFPEAQGGLSHVFRMMEKWVGIFTHGTVFVGRELRDQYLRTGVTRREKAHVIYTGRDFHNYRQAHEMSSPEVELLRSEQGISREDLVLGYVARIVPSKGHEVAIEAFREIKKDFPRSKMIFVGKANLPREQSHLEHLQDIVSNYGLEDEILFLGYRPDVERYYRIMDVFVLPSHYEGLPNVVVEAVSMGVPVVAFDCGGVREVLDLCPGAGQVVDSGDFQGLVRRLRETIISIHQRGTTPKRKAEFLDLLAQVWSTSKMLEQTDKLYSSLYINQKSGRLSSH